jgi:hypothetical protein
MKSNGRVCDRGSNRRGFLKGSAVAVSSAAIGAGILANGLSVSAHEEKSGSLTAGDASILRFLAAAEILETDLWVQYNELGGIQDDEVPGGSGSPAYTAALQVLDADMSQYLDRVPQCPLIHEITPVDCPRL